MAKRAKRNYVNNADFLEALIAYKKACTEAEDAGDEKPRCPDYIGKCIYQIATRLATKPNFSGYSYKDDMISHVLKTVYCIWGILTTRNHLIHSHTLLKLFGTHSYVVFKKRKSKCIFVLNHLKLWLPQVVHILVMK